MSAPDAVTLGSAVTHGQLLPLGRDDPVVAARAVRRALADAGRKAGDVRFVVVAAEDHIPSDVLRAFIRRALGPPADEVQALALTTDRDGPDARAEARADAMADLAADALRPLEVSATGVGLVVGIGVDGTTVARCIGQA